MIKHGPNLKDSKSPHHQSPNIVMSVQGEFISPIKRIISTNEGGSVDNSMTVYKKSNKVGFNNLMPLSEDPNEDREDRGRAG